jgi:transcription initiation factor TFIID subunit 6
MKTLLLALISSGKSHGTREGAIRGLVGVGKEAVRKGLVEGWGEKVVGAEWESGEGGRSTGLVNSVMVRLELSFIFRSRLFFLKKNCRRL